MRIEELSIGDWVKYLEREWQVFSLDKFTGEVGLWRNDSQLTEDVTYIEPIPLTPEILEKNGFEREQYTIDIDNVQEIEYNGYRHILCQDGVQYDIILVDSCGGYFDLEIESSHRNEDGDRILISSTLSLNYVEFVHQLQHALRLAGIEKEIEL